MAPRIELPTKAQVGAISDAAALHGLRDDIERAVIDMETRLEFDSGDDPDWAARAKSALSLHRYTDRLLVRRIRELKQKAPQGQRLPRPDADNDPLTNEVFAARPEIDPATLQTVEAVDEAITWIAARIIAVETDRNDEVALPAQERDEGFLAAASAAIKAMKGVRIALQTRRGVLSRTAKALTQATTERRREEMFIDAARELLPKAAYAALWARVDREVIAAAGLEVAA